MSGEGASVTLPPGYRLVRYETVGSTNDQAKRLAHDGAPSGTLVWAGAQSQGRGRRGRPWESPCGNLYVSMLLRPACAAAQAAQLGFVAALALADALQRSLGPRAVEEGAFPPHIALKWPNDVLVNRRKVAGILLESETGRGEAVEFVVIGIGVNIAAAPAQSEYPATSLAAEGADLTPAALLERLIAAFDDRYRQWRDAGFAPVRRAWLERATGLGEPVRVRLERATLHGRFLDLDGEGALLLDSADGPRRIAAGEVFPAI